MRARNDGRALTISEAATVVREWDIHQWARIPIFVASLVLVAVTFDSSHQRPIPEVSIMGVLEWIVLERRWPLLLHAS